MAEAGADGRRICIFGGTFDPIHNAHLEIASAAREQFALDEVLFVPAGRPPHKNSATVTRYADRLRMVEIACKPYPYFTVSRLEESDERSYTVNTLARLRSQLTARDELFFLIGADAFDELETWKCWEQVVTMTEFIVVSRPGNRYRTPANVRVLQLSMDLPVSSSAIRARLANREATPEVPQAVREYIDARGLYGAPNSGLNGFG